jgi:hypothetical protein
VVNYRQIPSEQRKHIVVGAKEGRRVEAAREASSAAVSSVLCGDGRPPVWSVEREEVRGRKEVGKE